MLIDEAVVRSIVVHEVGNPLKEEPLKLAEQCFSINAGIADLILEGYLRGILVERNLHLLTHKDDASANPVAELVKDFFANKLAFIDLSQKLASQLFASTHHASIASGDLFVVHFDKIKTDDGERSAIGLFKSESRQQYIAALADGESFRLETVTGINPGRIDKGALLIEGWDRVYALDRSSSRNSAKFWLEDFLVAKQIPDERTKSTIAVNLVEEVQKNIVDPVERQEFGHQVIALCASRESVQESELKELSEKFVPTEVWESELDRITDQKGLTEVENMAIPAKKFEKKLKKSLNRVSLGNDIVLAIPSDLSFEGVEFKTEGKTIQISIVLENREA